VLKDGEAVITRFDQVPVVETVVRPVIGSSATVSMCKNFSAIDKSKPDPFQLSDPWAKVTAGDAAMEPVGAGDVVAALEQRVVSNVISQLPTPAQGVSDEVSSRVEALEQQVLQITHQQQQLHHSFQEQSVAQQSQLTDLQVQFQAQHGQLEMAVAEQGRNITGLASGFQIQLEKQQSQLDRMFSQQMSRIEDLLGANKKPRVD